MKQLNTMKFISNAVERLTELKEQINHAETYEEARSTANAMQGYLECLNTFNNTMICMENNDFTADFDTLLSDWHVKTCQALINKAEQTGQNSGIIYNLLVRRDKYKDSETESDRLQSIERITTAAATSGNETDTVADLLKKRNAENLTENEEKAEIRMWTEWTVASSRITDALRHEGIRGIEMSKSVTGTVTVHKGIYKLAYILGVKVKERYDPESEHYPFKYEFKYSGVEFYACRAEHIACPEEYREAIYTSADEERQAV